MSLERTLLGASEGVGEGDLVIVGDHGLDSDVQIGERAPQLLEQGLEALRSGLLVGCRVVVDAVRIDEVVEGIEVAGVDRLPEGFLGCDVGLLVEHGVLFHQ